jgi:hypothetical protein
MNDDINKQLAKLKQALAEQKAEVEALKAAQPKPKPEFKPMSDAEWRDRVHQMRERQANTWMPPDAIRDLVNGEPKGFMQGVVHDNRAPNHPGMIPSSQQPSAVRAPQPSATPGYVDPRPLSNPPGTGPGSPADKIVDEFDRRDRAELKRKLGE